MGPFLLSVGAFATAGVVATMLLRPDPLLLARRLFDDEPTAADEPGVEAATADTAARPLHGDHLAAVGPVISLHIAVMFAPSPLTGRLVDRLGARRVVAASAWLVVASGVGAQMAGPTNVGLVAASMALLGLGWNGSFVAGSSLLASAAAPGDRPRVQGVVDATAGVAAMLAGILAGVLATTIGYAGIGVVVAWPPRCSASPPDDQRGGATAAVVGGLTQSSPRSGADAHELDLSPGARRPRGRPHA